jgi:hypothetical protein
MSNKKGFLTGLIFKQEDEGASEQDPKVGKSASVFKGTSNAKGTSVQNFSSTPQNVQGVIDNKFVDQLTALIEQNNIPGQDYFEFKQAIENLKTMAMSDEQKFKTIYAVLSNQGLSVAILNSSLDKYVSIIQGEKANFNKDMEAQYQKRVTAKLAEAESAKKEMETITKRMAELNTKILNVTQEAGAEEQNIRAIEANFMASADIIINEMLSDKEKINNYLK